jgi:hypothetical protein
MMLKRIFLNKVLLWLVWEEAKRYVDRRWDVLVFRQGYVNAVGGNGN